MAKIIVLTGGTSNEREVSLRSGTAVAEALTKAGHDVQQIDPADGLPSDILQAADVVFPVLHGAGGEDGSLQKQLDDVGVSYVGSGVASSELCFDKWQYKQFISSHGLPTPEAELVDQTGFWESGLVMKPFVLKPNDGGSSVDTYIHRDAFELPQEVIPDLFSRHEQLLLEALIAGTETTVAVLGDQALPMIEIIPPSGAEFDYDNKYNGQTQELCPPQHVDPATQQRASELALQAHKLCGCRDFSRTDIMIGPGNDLFILETNTIPGMTGQSLFPKAAAAAGIPMEKLVDQLVRAALDRKAT